MRKNYLIFIIIAVPFLLTSCITPGLKETNPVGKIYRDSIQLWEKVVPLPEGEWKVIGRGGPSNSFQDPYFEILLLKEFENKKMHGVLAITTESMTNSYTGYWPHNDLKREDVHHIVVKSNEDNGAQDGWTINNIEISINVNRTTYKEAMDYLVSNSYIIPKNVIQIFHHFTGKYKKNKYLDVRYYLNPEIEGFEVPNETNWGTSEWHPLRIDNDPKKKAYIERLKEEGTIMHEKIRAGFGE